MLGLFSGLQMVNILCSVVKNKLVAMWLQASGVGLFGIYNTTIETIGTLTDLGLRQSAVRDVAQAADNPPLLVRAVAMVRRWAALAGILGALIISFASPMIAKIVFGDSAYCWGFVLLSASMFLNSVVNGESAILQGTSLLKRLAKATLWGNLVGLALSVPMFYYLGAKSVVLSIIAYSVANCVAMLCVRVKTSKCTDSTRSLIKQGSKMAKFGVAMATAAFITNLANLALLTWLNRTAGTDIVGYYQAGATLVVRYVGLIFTAVAVEYYPRLCAADGHKFRIQTFVNHETTLLLTMVTPVVLLFLIFRYIMVHVLYTPEFDIIIPYISLAILSTPFKAISYCGAYSILAKGDSKIYVLTESVDSAIGLALNILLYKYMGLVGVGLAFVIWYFGYTIIIYLVYRLRYRMRYNRDTTVAILLSLTTCAAAWCAVNYLPNLYSYILLAVMTAAWLPFAYRMYRR